MSTDRLTEAQWSTIIGAIALADVDWSAMDDPYFQRQAVTLDRARIKLLKARREGRI